VTCRYADTLARCACEARLIVMTSEERRPPNNKGEAKPPIQRQ